MGDEEVDRCEIKDNPSGILKELKLELIKILKVGNLTGGVVAVAVEWVHPLDSEIVLWCILDESELGQVNNQENKEEETRDSQCQLTSLSRVCQHRHLLKLDCSDCGNQDVQNTSGKQVQLDWEEQCSPWHWSVEEICITIESISAGIEMQVTQTVNENKDNQENS